MFDDIPIDVLIQDSSISNALKSPVLSNGHVIFFRPESYVWYMKHQVLDTKRFC